MNFKQWLENVALIKQETSTTFLGRFAWWNVWNAEPNVNLNDLKQQLTINCSEAAYKLSSLGFPRMNANILIKNIQDETNWITGVKSGVGGYADFKKHGFVVSTSNLDLQIIIHEHAHMFWKNLPKPNKQFFQTYYNEITNVKNFPKKMIYDLEKDTETMLKTLKDQDFGLETHLINYDMLINNNETLKIFFAPWSNQNDDYNALSIAHTQTWFIATLKKPIELTYHYGRWNSSKNLEPGNKVKVFKGDKFIIELREDSMLYESNVMDFEEILEYVKLEKNENYENLLKLGKEIKQKTLTTIISGKNNQFFQNLFNHVIDTFEDKFEYVFNNNKLLKNITSELKQYEKKFESSWNAYATLNAKNIENIKELYSLIERFISEKIKPILIFIVEKNLEKTDHVDDFNPSQDTVSSFISFPKGQPLRQHLANQGHTVSDYGASNIDEIWATSVEHAALGLNVDRKLKKLIYQTINGF